MSELTTASLEISKLANQTKSQFDKALLTLSTAAIGVIVSFPKNIPLSSFHKQALWGFFITIICTLVAGLFSYLQLGNTANYLVATEEKEKIGFGKKINFLGFLVSSFTVASIGAFLGAMLQTVLGFTS